MNTKTPQGRKGHAQGGAHKRTDKDSGGNPMGRGMGMMKKMMGSGADGPMAMKQKMMGQKDEGVEGHSPMQQMMGMCTEMMASMRRTTSIAVAAQPELHSLFEEWLTTREDEALKLIAERGPMAVEELATGLSMSAANATAVLVHLLHQGKIRLRAEVSPPS
ncbi:MAG: MarR family transcriptional regulator [Acidiferrobacter sp.]